MAAPSQLTSAAVTAKINGIDLHKFGVVEYEVNHLGMAPVNVAFQSLPSRHISVPFTGAAAPNPFTITGRIFDNSVANLRTHLENLKSQLVSLKHRNNYFDRPAPIYIELADYSDRHYPCIYTGPFNAITVGTHPAGNDIAQFTLPLLQLTPFSVAKAVTASSPSGTGPSFAVLTTGTAPCPALIEIEGVANAADFILANCAFYADFDYDLVADIIDGTTNTGAMSSGTASDQMAPGEFQKGRFEQAVGSFNTTWSSVVNNPDEFTMFAVGRVLAAYTTGVDAYVLMWEIDANNRAAIYFDEGTDKWTFLKRKAAADLTADTASTSTHAAGDYVTLAASCGPDGMKLYVNGALDGTDADTGGVTGSSGTVRLGHQSAIGNNCPFKHEYAAIFPFQMSDEEITKLMGNPQLIAPANLKKSKTGNLTDAQRSVIDTEKATITKVDTDLTQTNDIADWDNNGFMDLHPNKSCLYVPSGESIAGIDVAYRKYWW